ncbi:hypothetical protein KR018_006171, partial [Drosophila ironensis]
KVIVVESKSTFDKLLGDAGPNMHVLVEFYATWCGPCAMIGPKLEQLAGEYNNKMMILKVDVDNNEELAVQYNVTSMPTFVIIKNQVTLIQFVGSNASNVVNTVEKYV